MMDIKIFFILTTFISSFAANSIFDQSDIIPVFPYHKKFISQNLNVPYLKTTTPVTTAINQISGTTTLETPFTFILPTQATPMPTTTSTSISYIDVEDNEDLLQECQSLGETSGPKNIYNVKLNPCLTTLCTCQQVKECNQKAFQKMAQCKELCQSYLSNFGSSINNYFICFNDTFEEYQQITHCLNNTFAKFAIHGKQFCSTSSTKTLKKNYTKFLESFAAKEIKEDSLKNADKIIKKARNVFADIRNFEKCVIKCFMEETIECYKDLECDINIPGKNYSDKIYETCLPLKRQTYKNAMKSCQCLAFKQNVKKLVGTCAHVGNAFLMRNL